MIERFPSSDAEAFAAAYARAAFRRSSRRRAIAALVEAAKEMSAKGEHAMAQALYRQAAKGGHHGAVVELVNWPGIREDHAAMEDVYRAPLRAGDVQSLASLAALKARQGDTTEARMLFAKAIESGDVGALTMYAAFLHNHGEPGELSETIEHHYHEVMNGDSSALSILGALLLSEPHRQAEAVLREGTSMIENQSRCLLAALLLSQGAIGEGAELVRRLRITGDDLVRDYADRLAVEYELSS